MRSTPERIQRASVIEAECRTLAPVQNDTRNRLAVWVIEDIAVAGHEKMLAIEELEQRNRGRVCATVMRPLDRIELQLFTILPAPTGALARGSSLKAAKSVTGGRSPAAGHGLLRLQLQQDFLPFPPHTFQLIFA